MNRSFVFVTALIPALGLAAPGKKIDDVRVVSMPPVSVEGAVTVTTGGSPLPTVQTLVREPFLGQTAGSDTSANRKCEAEFTAPAGLVIETLSFVAETEGDTRHFDDYVAVGVTTDLESAVTGAFHFPTENKKFMFRSGFSPPDPVTKYRNTMSVRLYPDAGSAVSLSISLINPDNVIESASFNSCSLWVSGYLVGDTDSGLGP